MCVAQTAKRRRRQAILDPRFKKRPADALEKREAERRERLRAMQARAGGGKK